MYITEIVNRKEMGIDIVKNVKMSKIIIKDTITGMIIDSNQRIILEIIVSADVKNPLEIIDIKVVMVVEDVHLGDPWNNLDLGRVIKIQKGTRKRKNLNKEISMHCHLESVHAKEFTNQDSINGEIGLQRWPILMEK